MDLMKGVNKRKVLYSISDTDPLLQNIPYRGKLRRVKVTKFFPRRSDIRTTMVEINYWTNGKTCAKVAFPRYTESVTFRSQSRETASKRRPYPRLGTR